MNFDSVTKWRIPVNGVTRDVLKVTRNNVVLWEKETEPVPTPDPETALPFYVENITSNTETLNIYRTSTNTVNLNTIEYSLDNTVWRTLGTTGSTPLTLNVSPKTKVYLRSAANAWENNVVSGCTKIGGNILSLFYGSSFTGQETTFPGTYSNIKHLFRGSNVKYAHNLSLPVTFLPTSCYYELFRECLSLYSVPLLPATTLANSCYSYMFRGCTSLTTAPELPATTLATNCYNNMFSGCTSLSHVPTTLPATALANYCYYYMFQNCPSLTAAPALPATTLATSCYDSMFRNCSSLITAPVLPATALVKGCYQNMFRACSQLNNVICLATTGINTNSSTLGWLSFVSSTGTFTKAARVTWPTGSDGIPEGWTVVEV